MQRRALRGGRVPDFSRLGQFLDPVRSVSYEGRYFLRKLALHLMVRTGTVRSQTVSPYHESQSASHVGARFGGQSQTHEF